MANLSVADVQRFKQMLHELKEQFQQKRDASKGSRERMKLSASKCVQVHNEAEKRKALGRPGIDPRAKSMLKHILTLQGRDNRALSSLPA